MNTQQANRLLNVARACRESEHADKFSMEEYAHPCGTPGCALGNYAMRQDLQKTFGLTTSPIHGRPWLMWKSISLVYFDSLKVMDHFGLIDGEAWELFSLAGCNNAQTPEEAADYIEQFVRDKGFDVVEVEA